MLNEQYQNTIVSTKSRNPDFKTHEEENSQSRFNDTGNLLDLQHYRESEISQSVSAKASNQKAIKLSKA